MSVQRLVIISLLVFSLSGCVPIDQSLLLNQGTKVEISDVSPESLASSSLVKKDEDLGLLRSKIMQITKDELSKRSIEAVLLPTQGAAKLKYDFRAMISSYKKEYEIVYRVSFETPDGKLIFEDGDEKDGKNFDDVNNKISRRVADFVANSFKSLPVK